VSPSHLQLAADLCSTSTAATVATAALLAADPVLQLGRRDRRRRAACR